MGLVMSVGTSAASALASCCVGSAASCVCSGLKAIMPSGYSAAKVYALILFFGARACVCVSFVYCMCGEVDSGLDGQSMP
jgi:cytochrome bd-type quinol oxidase subunit 2